METECGSKDVHGGGARSRAKTRVALGRGLAILALVLASSSVVDCAAEVGPAPAVPVNYYDYPYTYYDGHIVYYVNGGWYYPYGNRWYMYHRVPPELARRGGSYYSYGRPYAAPSAHPYYRSPAYTAPTYRTPYGRGGGPRDRDRHR